MSKQTNSKTIKTSIGGQAVIEGVMMRGPKLTALSVRMPDQSISTETWDTPNSNKWYKKTPFIRGVFNFVESMTDGYKSLMKAAEKAGLDEEAEEPSKFEQKLRQLLGDKFMPFLQGCILLFSLAMALFFFAFLPTTLVGFFRDYISHPLALSALEGLTKIAILILYLALISNMNDIKRVFMYHGAEHKTIFCYEHGEELTVDCLMCAVCNGRTYGGGFYAAPEARPDDGWLDVFIIRRVGRLTIARLLGMYKGGKHFRDGALTEQAKPYFLYRRAKCVSLRPADGRGPIVATADGECAPCEAITARLRPLAGHVLLPKPAYERFMAQRASV